ncbi:hypothetical protein HDV63DRAFT_409450 [Trichoderma sp. SZMC 28014]
MVLARRPDTSSSVTGRYFSTLQSRFVSDSSGRDDLSKKIVSAPCHQPLECRDRQRGRERDTDRPPCAAALAHNVEFLGFGRILIEHNVRLMEKEASVKLTRMMDVCEKGGIVGRGILVNWLRWWEHQNPGKEAPSAISTYSIPASELEEVLKFQGTEYRQGDILIVRTGFVRWHDLSDEPTRIKGTSPESKILTLIDVGSNMDTVRWLYSKHFSVARDTIGWDHRRNVGFGHVVRCLRGAQEVVVFLDECAAACRWGCWIASECDCDTLVVCITTYGHVANM